MKMPQFLRLPACLGLIQLTALGLLSTAHAGSATWGANPPGNDWNSAPNWNPNTVPNGSTSVASFASSATTNVSITAKTTVDSIVFAAGASPFTISADTVKPITISGAGISNLSGVEQNIVVNPVGELDLINSATISAGTMLSVVASTSDGGFLTFNDSASAGQATIALGGPFTLHLPAVYFRDQSTAGSASIVNRNGGFVLFDQTATADAAQITCEGSDASNRSGQLVLQGNSTAATATITATGALEAGGLGGVAQFYSGRPANATLIATGGLGGGPGGLIRLGDHSDDSFPRVELFGNGYLYLGYPSTIGSVEGDGLVSLSGTSLTIGGNGLNTSFIGLIEDDLYGQYSGGSITKTGPERLTLTAANLYTGGTTVNSGVLLVANTTGSATGTGAVSVNAGTLGGSGIISGAVTVGAGAFLAPAKGSNRQVTLTLQSSLIWQSGATYTYTFKAKGNKARTDKVIANGVTINSGATFVLSGTAQGMLTQGLALTAISNTAATPMAGTFGNLPNGAILTVGANHLQASYTGGDGNDLTLTVVP